MKYARILTAFCAEPWAMDRDKMRVVLDFLAFKAAGGVFSAEEVAGRISGARSSEIARTEGVVGVIPITGVLSPRMDMMTEMSGGTTYSGIKGALHAALANDAVKAVVLDFDTPGGAVTGGRELADEIRALRGGSKPIIAQVNHMAASMGYWLASQADEIVVSPSAQAGSIGVYTVHDDMSAALAEAGVRRTYISAGEHKTEGNEAEPLSESARAHMKERVDMLYGRFVGSVAEGRKTSKKDVLENFGKGRALFAEDLIDRGMADTIATMDETLARFGADQTPEPVRQIRAANAARAEEVSSVLAKLKAGEPITIRELENGILKGLGGLTNSEAERSARRSFKFGQGEPDTAEDKAVLEAIERAIAAAKSFKG